MSEEKSPTPGPWNYLEESEVFVVQPMGKSEYGAFFVTPIWGIQHGETIPIAFAPFWDDTIPDDQDEATANARLIAAAAELLEACKAFLDYAELPSDTVSRDDYIAYRVGTLGAAKAAIAKAEGRIVAQKATGTPSMDWIPGKMDKRKAEKHGFTQVEPGECELCEDP